jgi:hypothetical protein
LLNKINLLYWTWFPLLDEKGYLADGCKVVVLKKEEEAGPLGFEPKACGYLHPSQTHTKNAREGSEDRRDILTTLRAPSAE